MRTTLALHVLFGSLGIVSGFVALFATKGLTLHRRVGMVFVATMLPMCAFGLVITLVRNVAPVINIPAALLTAYLIVTSLATVRPRTPAMRRLELGAMLVALGVGVVDIGFGIARLTSGRKVGILAIPFFLFGTIALLSFAGDVRAIRAGGLTGAKRLARHLWRMSFALWIAAMSFFVGQADVLPAAMRAIPGLLWAPGLVVLGTMLFWLWRVRVRKVFAARFPAPGRDQTSAARREPRSLTPAT